MKTNILILSIIIGLLLSSSSVFALTIPWGVWKGIAEFKFTGKIIDEKSGKPIKEFVVNEKDHTDENCSEGKTTKSGPQTIITKDGEFTFSLYFATLNGQSYMKNFKVIDSLGKANESVTIKVTAKGYEDKLIDISQDRLIVGQEYKLGINMVPENK